jgi:aquaporin Z
MTVRSKIAILASEFLGTAVLATVAINISRSQIGIGYFVAIGVGLTLGLLVLALGPVSGGHFNPAVTIGLWTVRKVKSLTAITYITAQMLGGLAAWQLANYFAGQEIQSIANATRDWKILVVEGIATAVFTLLIAAAVFQKYEGAKAAGLIGGGLTVGVIIASQASNAVLNPAVALANQSWSLSYALGPVVGAIIGMNLYVLLFAPADSVDSPSIRNKEVSVSKVVTPAAKTRATKSTQPAKTATTSTAKRKTTARKKK